MRMSTAHRRRRRCALLAACNQSRDDGNAALAEANATGNEAAPSRSKMRSPTPSATPLQKEQALALMKERHENYEKIGDAMKVVSRELKGDSPDLAQVRSNADDHRRRSRRRCDLVPGRHRPGRRQDRRQGRNLAEARGFRGQGARLRAGRRARSRPPREAPTSPRSARRTATRQELQGLPRPLS